jgi:hypothetical protein
MAQQLLDDVEVDTRAETGSERCSNYVECLEECVVVRAAYDMVDDQCSLAI